MLRCRGNFRTVHGRNVVRSRPHRGRPLARNCWLVTCGRISASSGPRTGPCTPTTVRATQEATEVAYRPGAAQHSDSGRPRGAPRWPCSSDRDQLPGYPNSRRPTTDCRRDAVVQFPTTTLPTRIRRRTWVPELHNCIDRLNHRQQVTECVDSFRAELTCANPSRGDPLCGSPIGEVVRLLRRPLRAELVIFIVVQ